MAGRLGQNGDAFSVGGREYVARDLYVYEERFAATDLIAGATVNGQIDIQADSDFVWQKAAYFADISAAGQEAETRVVPLCRLQLIDTGSGRNLFEQAVPVPSVFGTGELPFVLPVPRLFFARSTITLQVTNFDASNAYGLSLSFIGYKAYPRGM